LQPIDLLNSAGDLELVEAAIATRKHAYCPYSEFAVGAAIRCASGAVYNGCNIENASLGLTICAERVALFTALASGERSFVTLALATEKHASSPCGACCQVLTEFAPDLRVVTAIVSGPAYSLRLTELLPFPFALEPSR
jgi:cytidine deaminase